MTCRFVHDDAAYVLGALAPAERLELERHLDGCPACTRRIREVAGLSGLLARVSPEVLEEGEPGPARDSGSSDSVPSDSVPSDSGPPDSVLPRLLQAVRRDRRRRRWVEVGLVAAAGVVGVVLAGGITGGLTGGDPSGSPQETPAAPATSTASPSVSPSPSPNPPPSPPPTARARPMRPVGDTSMTVELAMTQVPWGTRFDLTCSYPATGTAGPGRPTYGGGGGTSYALVVRTRDGDLEQVATWHALPGQTMQLTAPTSTRRDRIAEVQVRTADGSPLLQLRG